MRIDMTPRSFGKTDLSVSPIGFGAWAIGGPAMAGDTPIGWGEVDDDLSRKAILRAIDRGITFFDTADIYGIGHSESLIGEVIGNRDDVVIATKVGHRVVDDRFVRDYDPGYIIKACEQSLTRLRRDQIDFYQLHSARVDELRSGGCVDAMERLRDEGKIRYWGVSLDTFNPFPEADFIIDNAIGDGLQLVLNVINQRALPVIERASAAGYGIIARMPLQFGVLTGKFDSSASFGPNDHRSSRLSREVLDRLLSELEPVWPIASRYNTSQTGFSLSYAASVPGISTVIPGIRTPEQAEDNTSDLVTVSEEDLLELRELYERRLDAVVDFLHDSEK
jgi:aryl-alcohol dehydrogenase-like predicted oxidoreductase